jgi:diaminohydroxyphosphoribosylaminopyrimidine deaminase/5-amino-6-(5-phosphoribosylamino)uracil reductase
MREALALARRGRGRTAPNPVVGACVIGPDGMLVGRGITAPAGGRHAEVQALDEAGDRARGATLYCTLEPCAHVGRTGPCTARIIAAGIGRVVVAMGDPFPLVRGRGLAALRDHGIEVTVGDGFAEAVQLNRPYLRAIAARRPFVVLKAATSLDGRIAAREGVRTRLTSSAANLHVHLDRAQIDGIAVGSKTVLVDDPLLTARGVRCERPLARVVFDRRLRTPPGARLFSTLRAGPVIILTSPGALERTQGRARALEAAGATVVAVEGRGVAAGLQELVPRGIHSLILEGGAAIHRAAWHEGVVDFVSLYIAPVELGAEGVPLLAGRGLPLAGLDDVHVETLGPDVVIEGYVHRAH